MSHVHVKINFSKGIDSWNRCLSVHKRLQIRALTTLQISQFFVVFIHSLLPFYFPCDYPLVMCKVINIFSVLFSSLLSWGLILIIIPNCMLTRLSTNVLMVLLLLHNAGVCDGCIAERILLLQGFHSWENQCYPEHGKKTLHFYYFHRAVVKQNH